MQNFISSVYAEIRGTSRRIGQKFHNATETINQSVPTDKKTD